MLLPRVAEAKEAFASYSAQLAAITLHAGNKAGGQDSDDLTNIVLAGLQLLAHWTTAVVEQFTWKFTHPCDR